MNDPDKLWTISHDVIEMFSKDFGLFKGMALKTAYDYIYQMDNADLKKVLNKIHTVINMKDDKDAKKKEHD